MIRHALIWLCLFHSLAVYAQDKLEIFNIPANPPVIPYCKGDVPIADHIQIEGRSLDQENDGIKVSISNYIKGEDTLVFKGTGSLTAAWNNDKGEMVFTGKASAAEYLQAVKKVFYRNLAARPTPGNRNLSVTLSDADYLPHTGHFYRYIASQGIWWSAARNQAAAMTYNGLRGYLATITSQIENDFIWDKTKGVGWIGASDEGAEGVWRWVTGPEAGTQFWQGNGSGNPVNGMYSNWNTGEPNNTQKSWGEGENYAHINMNPSSRPRSWNDLPDRSDGPNSQWYYSQGFIVEFGGMPGDPVLRLTATQAIRIDKVPFSGQRDFEICAGEQVRLNLSASGDFHYSWSPAQNISSPNAPDPVVNPSASVTYRAIGEYGGVCRDTAFFHVSVNPLPESLLKDTYALCEDGSVTLDPGDHVSYLWNTGETGRTLQVSTPGTYSVTIRNERCSARPVAAVYPSPRPRLNYDVGDTLVCGPFSTVFGFELTGGTSIAESRTPGMNISGASTGKPELKVNSYGSYAVNLKMTNSDGCRFDSLISLSFRHQPTALFNIDSSSCYGYNLQVEYRGDVQNDAVFSWFSADTLFSEGINLKRDTIPLGKGANISRSVWLTVNEQGCTARSSGVNVKIKPDLDLIMDRTEGCSPLEVKFTALTNPGVVRWFWDFGDTSGYQPKDAIHLYRNQSAQEKVWPVSLRVEDNKGCRNEMTLLNAVKVFPEPVADFTYTPEVVYIRDPQVTFENRSLNATEYSWDFGDGSPASQELSPRHSFGSLGFFDVALTAKNDFGCTNQFTGRLAVVFDRLFPPNAFSPNSIKEEDREFRLYSDGILEEGYLLRIFNRWGELVFESRTPELGWDGKMKNGDFAPGGVYTWVLQYLDFRESRHNQQGTVTLLF